MSYTEIPDDIAFTTPVPSVDRAAVAIRDNIGRVEAALTEFDKISAGLADLATRYPLDLAYDVTTTKGMAEAVAHRAAWRDPRISVEKYRKTAKAPVLALGKDIDARAAWLTEKLLEGEKPVDDQIKAEEACKERIKQDRIAAEFGRVQAIQEAIAEIHMDAMSAASKPSSDIRDALCELQARVLDPAVFQDMLADAEAARAAAVLKLGVALKAKLHDESVAAQLAAERAELETLRAAAAAQKIKDEAERAERAAADAKRTADIAAEQARVQAELDEGRRALAEQQAALQREQAAIVEAPRSPALVIAPQQLGYGSPPATLKLVEINAAFGGVVTVDAAGLVALGFQRQQRAGSAAHFLSKDFSAICDAIAAHVSRAKSRATVQQPALESA